MGNHETIPIKTRNGIYYLACPDIVCCEADGAYTKISIRDNTAIMVSKTLKWVLEQIEANYIVRVGQSAAVNVRYIQCVDQQERTIQLLGGQNIHYTYKHRVLDRAIKEALAVRSKGVE